MTEEKILTKAKYLVEQLKADNRFNHLDKEQLTNDYALAIKGILESDSYKSKWKNCIYTYTNGKVIYYLYNSNGKFTGHISVNNISESNENYIKFSI